MDRIRTFARRRRLRRQLNSRLRGRVDKGICFRRMRSERSHCHLKLGLGINQEIRRADNALTSPQSLENDDRIVQLRTDLNFARFKIALSVIDEGHISRAGLQHPGRRDHQLTKLRLTKLRQPLRRARRRPRPRFRIEARNPAIRRLAFLQQMGRISVAAKNPQHLRQNRKLES